MEPWLSTPCSSSVSINGLFYFLSVGNTCVQMCNWVFCVSSCSSLEWEVPGRVGGQPWFHGYSLIHCWGSHDASHRWVMPRISYLTSFLKTRWEIWFIWLLLTGLYDFYEDTAKNIFVLNMPLGQKQTSMILIMPYHLEPLARLEKMLTRTQVDTWLSKMENKAVAISLPKISLEVSHNLQVNV